MSSSSSSVPAFVPPASLTPLELQIFLQNHIARITEENEELKRDKKSFRETSDAWRRNLEKLERENEDLKRRIKERDAELAQGKKNSASTEIQNATTGASQPAQSASITALAPTISSSDRPSAGLEAPSTTSASPTGILEKRKSLDQSSQSSRKKAKSTPSLAIPPINTPISRGIQIKATKKRVEKEKKAIDPTGAMSSPETTAAREQPLSSAPNLSATQLISSRPTVARESFHSDLNLTEADAPCGCVGTPIASHIVPVRSRVRADEAPEHLTDKHCPNKRRELPGPVPVTNKPCKLPGIIPQSNHLELPGGVPSSTSLEFPGKVPPSKPLGLPGPFPSPKPLGLPGPVPPSKPLGLPGPVPPSKTLGLPGPVPPSTSLGLPGPIPLFLTHNHPGAIPPDKGELKVLRTAGIAGNDRNNMPRGRARDSGEGSAPGACLDRTLKKEEDEGATLGRLCLDNDIDPDDAISGHIPSSTDRKDMMLGIGNCTFKGPQDYHKARSKRALKSTKQSSNTPSDNSSYDGGVVKGDRLLKHMMSWFAENPMSPGPYPEAGRKRMKRPPGLRFPADTQVAPEPE